MRLGPFCFGRYVFRDTLLLFQNFIIRVFKQRHVKVKIQFYEGLNDMILVFMAYFHFHSQNWTPFSALLVSSRGYKY